MTQSPKLGVLGFCYFHDGHAPTFELAGAGKALRPQLPLDAALVRDAGHHGFDHVVDHHQRGDP